jgi:hypothetical protein
MANSKWKNSLPTIRHSLLAIRQFYFFAIAHAGSGGPNAS